MNKKDFSRLVKECIVPVKSVLYADQTIEEALSFLRRRKIGDKIVYFYVVDAENRLKGVVPTRELLLRDPEVHIEDVMRKDVVHLRADQTLETAMEVLSKHRLLALPVVDEQAKLVGVIDVQLYLEESLDIANAHHQSDIFQILGLTIEEGKKHAPWKSYRIRMPWIFCNMAGGFACAIISRVFQLVLGKVLLLAMFIPLVLTVSESISMQSMTQSLHLLRTQKPSWSKAFSRVFVEWKIITLLALTCGILVGLVSLLWGQGVMPCLTIMVGLTFAILFSASLGTVVPLLLHTREMDPKIAAGPLVLMCTDVITTGLYLSLATWWLL